MRRNVKLLESLGRVPQSLAKLTFLSASLDPVFIRRHGKDIKQERSLGYDSSQGRNPRSGKGDRP